MNPEEIRALLTRIVENRDNQALVTELATQVGDAFTQTHTTLSSVNTELEVRDVAIKGLKEANMNLFLRVGNPTPPDAQSKLNDGKQLTYEDLLKDWSE